MSLLGAVAYLTHARVGIAVFFCALQRQESKPQIDHVRKLNKLVFRIQKSPRKLHYNQLQVGESRAVEAGNTHLRAVRDETFKKKVPLVIACEVPHSCAKQAKILEAEVQVTISWNGHARVNAMLHEGPFQPSY